MVEDLQILPRRKQRLSLDQIAWDHQPVIVEPYRPLSLNFYLTLYTRFCFLCLYRSIHRSYRSIAIRENIYIYINRIDKPKEKTEKLGTGVKQKEIGASTTSMQKHRYVNDEVKEHLPYHDALFLNH